MRRTRVTSRTPRGVAIIAVIIAMIIVEVVVVAYVLNARRDQHLGVDRVSGTRAFYAAEAGVSLALREFALNSDIDGDGTIGSISNDGNPDNDPTLDNTRLWVAGTVNGDIATLASRGHSFEARRLLDAQFSTSGFDGEGGGGGGEGEGLIEDRFVNVGRPNSLDDIDWHQDPVESVITPNINFPRVGGTEEAWPGGPNDDWARWFRGSIHIPQTGNWTFSTESDDGSRVVIDEEVVVDNDGRHSMRVRSGTVYLEADTYSIDVYWFDFRELHGLYLRWEGPGVSEPTIIPSSAFSH